MTVHGSHNTCDDCCGHGKNLRFLSQKRRKKLCHALLVADQHHHPLQVRMGFVALLQICNHPAVPLQAAGLHVSRGSVAGVLSCTCEEEDAALEAHARRKKSLCPCDEEVFLPMRGRSGCAHDWFEQYRERLLEAEQLILTTLNFELNVQHPYEPLISILNKLGLSKTVLVNLASNMVSEGLRSSLWLQFKPHHIAAGAAYLAAKFLNMDLAAYQNIWQEFQTTPSILQAVSQQLMELF